MESSCFNVCHKQYFRPKAETLIFFIMFCPYNLYWNVRNLLPLDVWGIEKAFSWDWAKRKKGFINISIHSSNYISNMCDDHQSFIISAEADRFHWSLQGKQTLLEKYGCIFTKFYFKFTKDIDFRQRTIYNPMQCFHLIIADWSFLVKPIFWDCIEKEKWGLMV